MQPLDGSLIRSLPAPREQELCWNRASSAQTVMAPCDQKKFWGHPPLLTARDHSLTPFPCLPSFLQLILPTASPAPPQHPSLFTPEGRNTKALKEIHLSLMMLTHFGAGSTGLKQHRDFGEEEEPSWGSPEGAGATGDLKEMSCHVQIELGNDQRISGEYSGLVGGGSLRGNLRRQRGLRFPFQVLQNPCSCKCH